MDRIYRKSLITGVIATLIATPGWGIAEPPTTRGTQDPVQTGQTLREQRAQIELSVPWTGLYGKTPKELHRMEVRGTSGDAVGRLKDIVARRDARQICAVISVGGILGIGAKQIVVPLDELRFRGDQLHVLASEGDLMKREVYIADQYRRVRPEDRPISDFAAFEAAPEEDPR